MNRGVYGVAFCTSCSAKILPGESLTSCSHCGSTKLEIFQPKPEPEPKKVRLLTPEPTTQFPNREFALFWEGSNRWIRTSTKDLHCLKCETCRSYADIEKKDLESRIKVTPAHRAGGSSWGRDRPWNSSDNDALVRPRHAGSETMHVQIQIPKDKGKRKYSVSTGEIEKKAKKAIKVVKESKGEFKAVKKEKNRLKQKKFVENALAIHPKTGKLVPFETAKKYAQRHGLPIPGKALPEHFEIPESSAVEVR